MQIIAHGLSSTSQTAFSITFSFMKEKTPNYFKKKSTKTSESTQSNIGIFLHIFCVFLLGADSQVLGNLTPHLILKKNTAFSQSMDLVQLKNQIFASNQSL